MKKILLACLFILGLGFALFSFKGLAQQGEFDSIPKDDLDRIGTKQEDYLLHWDLISKYFKVMDWWESDGRKRFNLIYPVACCILALPDSNGSQERTFSGATWMDAKLKKKQKESTFQSKVLLYKNTDLMEGHRKHVAEDRKKEAERKTKEMLFLSQQLRDTHIVSESECDDDSSEKERGEDEESYVGDSEDEDDAALEDVYESAEEESTNSE